jgi:hypothetical protein
VTLRLVFLSTAAAVGCGTQVSYTQTGATAGSMLPKSPAEVQVFLAAPPSRPYKEVGYVEAHQELYSNDDQSAVMQELRREAAQQGCDGVIVQSADTTVGQGFTSHGTGSMAVGTRRGFRGVCIVWEGPGSGGPVQSTPSPAGGLGYAFGDGLDGAKKACTDVGGTLSEAGEQKTCDRLPQTLTFAGRAELTFCSDKLCLIDVVAPFVQPTEGVALRRWNDAKRLLEEHYGRAGGGRVFRPAACSRRLMECLTTRQAEYSMSWKWSDGTQIGLSLEDAGGGPIVKIRYKSPLKTERPNVQGL